MINKLSFKDHEEWLSIRHKYLGGSDAGAVIGMNPYKSAYTLWAEKTDKIPPFEGNIATETGHYLEEFVAKMFEDKSGKKVRRCNYTMVNDIYPFACANVDRVIVGEKALLEIKTTTNLDVMKACRNGNEFPECYYAQVVHYLAVTGLEKAYLAVLINCREFKIFELERDQAEIDALMSAEKVFWDCVLTKNPPHIDGSQSTSDTISEMNPTGTDNEVNLMAYETDLAEYVDISEQIKHLTSLKDECANRIKAFMNDATIGNASGYKATWKNSTRKSFDAKKYADDNKELDLSSYYKVSNYRTFNVTKL